MTDGRTLQPGDEISHYRVVGPLGAGGMGEVYLAQDLKLERSVALKVLPAVLVRSAERVRRFVLEAKSASSLNHPNIVTIYEIGEDSVRTADATGAVSESEPVHFISMELISGKTLTLADLFSSFITSSASMTISDSCVSPTALTLSMIHAFDSTKNSEAI